MSSQGDWADWTAEQREYHTASARTCLRLGVFVSCAAGLALVCTMKNNPLGIGITGLLTVGSGAAALVAKVKENGHRDNLILSEQDLTPYSLPVRNSGR
jgi:ABC-type uncharacterized transport system permease subunit